MELIRGEGWGGGGEFGPEMLNGYKKWAAPLDFEEGFEKLTTSRVTADTGVPGRVRRFSLASPR